MQLAQEAILVQDACNPSAVAHFLVEVFDLLFTEGADTKTKCEDPIVRMIVSKLDSLTGASSDSHHFFQAYYDACQALAWPDGNGQPPS